MSSLSKSLLLFMLNCFDANLTLLWVRTGVATEGNALMARLLDMGNAPFLGTKLLVGAFAGYVLYRSSHLLLARRGMKLVLGIYGVLMLVHVATGFSALGWQIPETALAYLFYLPNAFLSLIF